MYNLFTRASIYSNHPSAASLPLSPVLLALLLVLLLVTPRQWRSGSRERRVSPGHTAQIFNISHKLLVALEQLQAYSLCGGVVHPGYAGTPSQPHICTAHASGQWRARIERYRRARARGHPSKRNLRSAIRLRYPFNAPSAVVHLVGLRMWQRCLRPALVDSSRLLRLRTDTPMHPCFQRTRLLRPLTCLPRAAAISALPFTIPCAHAVSGAGAHSHPSAQQWHGSVSGGSREHDAHPPPKLGTVGKRTMGCSLHAR